MEKILIDGMTNNMGGLEKFIYTIYTLLKAEYQVDFITADKNIPFEQEFKENGSVVYKITPRAESIIKFKRDIKNVLKDGKYDVLWFNKTTLSTIDSIRIAKKYGVKKIICHSHASKNMGGQFTLFMHMFNRSRINAYVNCKLACSTEAAKWFYGTQIRDVKIINNAVDVDKYLPDRKRIKYEKEKLHLDGKLVLGHVGRFSAEKNHVLLIDIFCELCKMIPSHLVLCGTGPLFDEIQKYAEKKGIEDKISFLGVRSDIPEILQAIDIVVFPSIHEGLPFVLVEAQAAGIPCIVSEEVSREAKLTDIMEFVNLNAGIDAWISAILKYKDYKKVSKKEELLKKGFTLENTKEEINKILG